MEEEEIPSSSKKLNLLFGVKLIQLLNFVFLPLFIIHIKGMIFDSSVYDKKKRSPVRRISITQLFSCIVIFS